MGVNTFAISAAGMALERARVEAAALNIANAHTTAAAGQAAYAPVRVVTRSMNAPSFAALMRTDAGLAALKPEYQLVPTNAAPHLVHEPGHPLADKNGFVSYPGVDSATEMMTMMDATRWYEANIAALKMQQSLHMKALDIGGNP